MRFGGNEQIDLVILLPILAVTLAIFTICLRKQWLLFKGLALPAILCSVLLSCGVIYSSSLIPGLLSLMSLPYEFGLFLAANLLLIGLLPRIAPTPLVDQNFHRSWTFHPSQLALVFLGLILCTPLLQQLKQLPWQLSQPNNVLGWDVVSYHLPALIEFAQQKSLWSMQGPYQSYGFGFELIAAFFSKPFYAHWGWVLGHWLSIAIIALAIFSINQSLAHYSDSTSRFRAVTISILALGMFSTMEFGALGTIGKNDLFMTAMVISSLTLLLTASNIDPNESNLSQTRLMLRKKWAWGLSSLCAGLALATKPSALGFAACVPAAIGVTSWLRTRNWEASVKDCFLSGLIVFIFGGFWLTRNLIIFHHLSPVLDGGWRHSVLANLHNPDLYRLRLSTLYIGLAILALPVSVMLALYERKLKKQLNIWWLISLFHLCALITLLVTPFMIQHGTWELRLAMPLMLLTAIIWSTACERTCALLARHFFQQHTALFGGIISIALILFIALIWHTQRSAPLPGYNQIGSLPKTGIYQWAWEQEEPLRIYSAGLRPYGLYGKRWQHQLFYDLHSAELNDLPYAKARLASIVQHFEPEVIFIATDPLQQTNQLSKPAITIWMDSQHDLFEPIYSDQVVSGYRVLPAAKIQLQKWLLNNTPPKMGG